jgi:MinD superfamily P-loop ATPase
MKVAIASGKEGTGKTSLTAAFAHLAGNSIICDLDVDAPDLHLVLHPNTQLQYDFHSGYIASIQPDRCSGCDTCLQMCRYDAVQPASPTPVVDPLRCEGCSESMSFLAAPPKPTGKRLRPCWQVNCRSSNRSIPAAVVVNDSDAGNDKP